MTLVIQPPPTPLRIDRDGVARVGQTRVTLDTIVGAFNDGATPEEISQQYDVVSLQQVYGVINYYLANREHVEMYLRERNERAEEVQRMNEARFNRAGLRDRLLARQNTFS